MPSLRVPGLIARVPGLFIATSLAIAACAGSASPAPSSGGSAAPSTGAGTCETAPPYTPPAATVTIRDFAFDPANVTIKAGQAVAWTNEDSSSHTATTPDGGCDTGSISRGATVTLVFPTAGTYTYTCSIHPTMPDATVEVTE